MTTSSPRRRMHAAAGQRGLTLIEFMVSIVLGLLMVAALAALIADQSSSRAEVDRSGRLIENGRYAVRTLAEDMQMAGYWGELSNAPAAPATLPDPCSLTVTDIEAAMGMYVQGYDAPVATSVPTCITDQLPGTDVVVVRRADPDSSSLETTPGVPDPAKLVASAGQVLVQTGMTSATQQFTYSLKAASATSTTNDLSFPLLKKDLATRATVRKVVVRIYYISKCSVPVSNSCANGDGGNPIPTLKMKELSASGGVPAWNLVTLAEGIENLQVDYGVDSDSDGSPDGSDVNGSAFGVADWPNVMTARIYLLARSTDKTPGYTDTKTYSLGTAGSTTATNDGYKRHVFVQSVRFVNPSARRQS